MGATNCPETPRQRMIGMMYLVYTAMLALNVSAEILNGFVTVGDSLEVTNNLLLSKSASSYQMFENAYNNNPGKIQENWDKAQVVRKDSKELVAFIDNMKYELIADVEKYKGGVAEAKKQMTAEGYGAIQKKDEFSAPTRYFLGDTDDGSKGKALELKKKIEAYQDKMISLSDPRFHEQLKKMQIDTKKKFQNASHQECNWQQYNFYHGVLVADIVVLNKLKSEILNQEYDIVNNLYSAISADDFKFDKVVAKVIPKETYIMQGGSYEADVIVAAYDSRSQLRGEVAGATLTATDSGTLRLKMGAGALGPKKYTGRVFVKKENGEMPYDFAGEYFVAAPSATISATKMNVLYIGVDNPISVGAPGVRSEDLQVSLNGAGGSIRKTGTGEYIATVKSQGKATIGVSAKIGGQMKNLGAMEYRVKTIPRPTVKIGNLQGGRVSKEELAAQGGFRVTVEGFDFPVTYTVTSYEMSFVTGGDMKAPLRGTGNKFTPEMTNQISKLRRGNKINIENIRVKGPDGEKSASNNQMVFTIQ
ncbi:MAG: gliding motility protein GldM [Bacteroidales bacterium]|nr:gliding motility protein GldM [Bacteroidales bacterium]